MSHASPIRINYRLHAGARTALARSYSTPLPDFVIPTLHTLDQRTIPIQFRRGHVPSLGTWLNVFEPKSTIPKLVRGKVEMTITVIAFLTGFLSQPSAALGIDPLLARFLAAGLVVLVLWISAALLWISAGILGGRSTIRENRIVFARSLFPGILMGLFVLALEGSTYLLFSLIELPNSVQVAQRLARLSGALLAFPVFVCEFAIVVTGLMVVYRFSVWRAIAAVLLSWVITFGIVSFLLSPLYL